MTRCAASSGGSGREGPTPRTPFARSTRSGRLGRRHEHTPAHRRRRTRTPQHRSPSRSRRWVPDREHEQSQVSAPSLGEPSGPLILAHAEVASAHSATRSHARRKWCFSTKSALRERPVPYRGESRRTGGVVLLAGLQRLDGVRARSHCNDPQLVRRSARQCHRLRRHRFDACWRHTRTGALGYEHCRTVARRAEQLVDCPRVPDADRHVRHGGESAPACPVRCVGGNNAEALIELALRECSSELDDIEQRVDGVGTLTSMPPCTPSWRQSISTPYGFGSKPSSGQRRLC